MEFISCIFVHASQFHNASRIQYVTPATLNLPLRAYRVNASKRMLPQAV